MSIVLELPPELESELAVEAARLQLPLSEYALRLLVTRPHSDSKPSTGAELLQYWLNADLVGSRPDITDTAAYSRILRQQAETRERP